MTMQVNNFVNAKYDNGEIVIGEIVKIRMFGDRVLLTVKASQGYRSIYVDKCVEFNILETV